MGKILGKKKNGWFKYFGLKKFIKEKFISGGSIRSDNYLFSGEDIDGFLKGERFFRNGFLKRGNFRESLFVDIDREGFMKVGILVDDFIGFFWR